MSAPKVGETVKYVRTGGLFEVSKVVNGFVILCCPDGPTQVMTGTEKFDLLFARVSAEDLSRAKSDPRSKCAPVPGALG